MDQQHITEAVKSRYGKAAQGVRDGGSAAPAAATPADAALIR